jgi:uncharacterized membrane protein
MEIKPQQKWQIRAAVLVIFLLGFLAGALTLNVYYGQRASTLREARRDRFEQMMNRLNLSAEQKTQVDQLMSETRQQFMEMRQQSEPRFAEIRKLTNKRLQTILTPEQWQQWQQMTSEMRQRRRSQRSRTDN